MKLENKAYDALKYIALIVLPAVATLYSGLAKVWGLPYGAEIPATIMLIDTFLGVLLKVSTDNYWKEDGDV